MLIDACIWKKIICRSWWWEGIILVRHMGILTFLFAAMEDFASWLWGPQRRPEDKQFQLPFGKAEAANYCKDWMRKDGNSFWCSLVKASDGGIRAKREEHASSTPVQTWRGLVSVWAGTRQTLGMQQSQATMERQTHYCIFSLEAAGKN